MEENLMKENNVLFISHTTLLLYYYKRASYFNTIFFFKNLLKYKIYSLNVQFNQAYANNININNGETYLRQDCIVLFCVSSESNKSILADGWLKEHCDIHFATSLLSWILSISFCWATANLAQSSLFYS